MITPTACPRIEHRRDRANDRFAIRSAEYSTGDDRPDASRQCHVRHEFSFIDHYVQAAECLHDVVMHDEQRRRICLAVSHAIPSCANTDVVERQVECPVPIVETQAHRSGTIAAGRSPRKANVRWTLSAATARPRVSPATSLASDAIAARTASSGHNAKNKRSEGADTFIY